MATDDLTTGSPYWWLDRLSRKMRARRRQIKIYDDYYCGDHNLMYASDEFEDKFGDLLAHLVDNWTQIVVDAVVERMKPVGFRWNSDGKGLQRADDEANRIWQTNRLDAEWIVLQREKLIHGMAYTLVDPFVDKDEVPRITVEHPNQMIVEHVAGSRWDLAAGLKMWTDEYGDELATLYLPNWIYKFKRGRSRDSRIELPPGVTYPEWAPRDVSDEPWPLKNPLGEVPIVEFENRARMLKPGESEIKNVIPNQDAINKLVADMMVASEESAYRQRYAIGIEIEYDDNDEPIPPFENGKLWVTEEEKAKLGAFEATDLRNFVVGIENRVQSTASQSRTPPHYFYLKGEFPSGESIKSAETGLVSKVREKEIFDGESLEATIQKAFRSKGDPRGDDMSAETIWGDPESRTESEMVDAAVKLKAIGVANEILQERIGMTPAQIRRNRALIDAQLLEESIFGNPENQPA